MSTPKRFFQSTQNLFRPIWRLGRAIVRGFMNRLLRVLVRLLGHPSRLTQAGFVLPTVVMVMLVVTLLTTAIVFRSFDRAKNASNFRVNQAVLNAATPGIDRAKAKLEALFADPLLPQGTPSELSIGNVLERDKYILGDEDRIQVEFDVDGSGQIDPPEEILTTAWRFPVDTDNNGRYDSISLYGIYFRNPETNNRERTPLDARTPPMATGLANNPACEQAVGTSASLVGTRGWYKVGGDLKKAFFVYVATVPITDKDDNDFTRPSIGQEEDYENYTGGNRGFSALEYQQDFARIPLSNNAILYDGDIEMASGPDFFINGRIFTNGNLLVRESGVGETIFRQVSSPESCFYEADKSKIVVGGNYVYGTTNKSDQGEIETHLFREGEKPNTGAEITDKNASVSEVSTNVAYNNKAYNQRIDYLVDEAFKKSKNSDPEEVKEKAKALIDDPTNPLPEERARRQALEIYFRNRTRRVPYVEVASTDDKDVALADAALIGSGDDLRPPNKWIFPFVTDETGKSNLSSNTGLTLNDQGATLLPAATEFDVQEERVNESFIGDRMLIGNNLPALWYIDPDGDGEGEFVGSDALQPIEGTKWNEPAGSQPRQRKTRVRQLDELDTIARDGFWERTSAEQPKNKLDGVGGLRIVTGAGAYLPFDDDISNAANPSHVVWPDTMPVIDPYAVGLPVPPTPPSWLPLSLIDDSVSPVKFPVDENNQSRPYLKMRASAVYHYTYKEGKEPIACVDNYYDPTNKDTAERATDGNTVNENGKVYGPAPQASKPLLEYQANLVYPNGRPVNQLLKDALAADDPTLAQQAAIDSTSCALSIYNTLSSSTLSGAGALGAVPTGYTLPDGTIKETAFLDARQVKLIDKDYNPGNEATGGDAKAITTDPVEPLDNSNLQPVPAPGYETLTGHYDLPIEQRYPLEVRATVIDLNNLRQETAAGGLSQEEYMLPNSGIIYATRDDALPDASNPDGQSISATDFQLDPTRRPNGIMLINGEKLWRTEDFREEEKGLILTSNLPVYVKGTFNKHTEQEFVNNDTTTNAEFYGRSQVNPNFACRNKDPRIPCPTGDEWRNATILSDAVTVLSQDFREGYRVEGDYDLRNNQIDNVASPDTSNDSSLNAPTVEVNPAQTPNTPPNGITLPPTIEQLRLAQGFWNNNFVTNGLSSKGYTFAANSIRLGFPASDVTPTDVFYSTTDESNVINSSYFNNFVTPIQRRVEAPEYVMEICRKLPVSECEAGDWVAGYDWDNNGTLSPAETNIKASDLAKVLADNGGQDAFTTFDPARLGAGTTARPPFRDSDRRFARRVAFLRDTDGIDESAFDPSLIYPPQVVNSDELVLQIITGGGLPNLSSLGIVAAPVPIGIDATGALNYYPYRNTLEITVTGGSAVSFPPYGSGGNIPRTQPNSLLYRTTNRFVPTIEEYGAQHPLWLKDGPEWLKTDPTPLSSEKRQAQPLLVPALQLQYPTAEDANEVKAKNENNANAETNWIPRVTSDEAKTTITDMIVATGDNPSRPPFDYDDNGSTLNHQGDFSGGVPNLVRFLENWDDATSEIQGSLIQIKRSNYATAPYFTLPETEENNNVRNRLNSASKSALLDMPQIYTTQNAFGKVPSFAPPNREWGFDVGILSQLPDLFSQQFTLPDTDEPNEFYREVSRDDEWVNVLLCGQVLDDNGDTRDYAINEDQRRSCT